MFDLERAIGEWRASMNASMPGQAETIDELETHLRDAVQQRVQSGQLTDAAWKASLQQLGTPQAIASEFGKLPPPTLLLTRAMQVVAGLYIVLAVLASFGVLRGFVAGRLSSLLVVHVWSIVLGYSAMLAVGSVAIWSILSRAFSDWTPAETRLLSRSFRLSAITSLILTFVGLVSGAIWFRQTQGTLWLLDLREMGGLCLLGWNLAVLWNLMRLRSERSSLVMGLLGCGLTGLAWIGPTLLSSVTSYGHSTTMVMTIVALASLTSLAAFLVVLALLPPGRLRFR